MCLIIHKYELTLFNLGTNKNVRKFIVSTYYFNLYENINKLILWNKKKISFI